MRIQYLFLILLISLISPLGDLYSQETVTLGSLIDEALRSSVRVITIR